MAFFAVTLETIRSVVKHPQADRLDLCTLEGMDFQFVTLKDQFKPGERVLYFPLDSILPQPLLARLGLEGKLAGAERNRIKTVKLRGEISQGIVARPGDFLTSEQQELPAGEITALLGLTKYEPEPMVVQEGLLRHLPQGAPVYDIEGADRFTEALEMLRKCPVFITEKLEGSNFSITLTMEDELFVNMRNHTIIPVEGAEHYFWQAARESGLLAKMTHIRDWVRAAPELADHHRRNLTLYGEIVGSKVQGNYYNLKGRAVYAFDLRSEAGFLSVPAFLEITRTLEIQTAPILGVDVDLSDWLGGKSLKEASNGRSVLNPDKLREGIVIKPMAEAHWSRGRLILKQRSPEYLAGED